jgi:hypothetical protein
MRDGDELFQRAFDEFKVTRQTSTGNGERYCGMTGVRGEPLPSWFVRDELGYDGPVGVRLCALPPQEALDERHRDAMMVETVPPPVVSARPQRAQRETKASRRAKLEQLEARALTMRRAA